MSELDRYYAQYDEAARLTKDKIHAVEYHTTLRALLRVLPDGARVLDACAGVGVYSFALAQKGFRVTAGDIVEKHAKQIAADPRAAALDGVYCGSILDLSQFPCESFDAVMNLGALYHLREDQEQDAAMRESLRVLAPGGILAFAYIQPFVFYYAQLCKAIRAATQEERIREYRELSLVQKRGQWSVFRAMTADQAEELAIRFHLRKLANICMQGMLYPLYPELDDMAEADFESFLRAQEESSEDPDIVKHGMHGLLIARKPE